MSQPMCWGRKIVLSVVILVVMLGGNFSFNVYYNHMNAAENIEVNDYAYGEKIKDIELGCGGKCRFAITEKGEVYAWGRNDVGQLGLGFTSVEEKIPLKIKVERGFLTNIKEIYGGGYYNNAAYSQGHAFALTNDGEIYAWGDNTKGQLVTIRS